MATQPQSSSNSQVEPIVISASSLAASIDKVLASMRKAEQTLQTTEFGQTATAAALAVRETKVKAREDQVESVVNQLRGQLAEARCQVKAGLEREKKLDDKLREARRKLGAAAAQLNYIGKGFPGLIKEVEAKFQAEAEATPPPAPAEVAAALERKD